MQIKEITVFHFKKLCIENSITYDKLATRSGVSTYTVYPMIDSNRNDFSVITIKKSCDGLNQ